MDSLATGFAVMSDNTTYVVLGKSVNLTFWGVKWPGLPLGSIPA